MNRQSSTTYFETKALSLGKQVKTLKNSVNPTNPLDLYQVQISKKSSFKLKLTGLKNNANVFLFNPLGQLRKASTRPGTKDEAIAAKVNPGTYYVAVAAQRKTSYKLQLQAAPRKGGAANPVPVVSGPIVFNFPGFVPLTLPTQANGAIALGLFDVSDFDSDFNDTPGGTSGAAATVDLSGSDFSVFPGSFFKDDSNRGFDAEFEIQNTGNANAGPFQVSFYLSPDNRFGGSDYFLGSYPVSGVAAGSTAELSTALSLPPASDPWWASNPVTGPFTNYYVGMVVDATNAIAETNEANNSGTSGTFGDYDEISLL